MVHIYRRDAGVWKFQKSIDSMMVGTDPSPGTYFGSSISISGNYAVIGEKNYSQGSAGMYCGRVYIIKKDTNGNWLTNKNEDGGPRQIKNPPNSTEYKYGLYGSSVAISGKYIVVGAPGNPSVFSGYRGLVYLYKIKDETWKSSKGGGSTIGIEERGFVSGKSDSE